MLKTQRCFLYRCFTSLLISLSVLLLVSCGDDSQPLLPGSSKDGLLTLNLMLEPSEPEQQGETAIAMLGIEKADVEVIGAGIKEAIKAEDVPLDPGRVTLKVPEGNNRVIRITGKDRAGNPHAVIKGYVKVIGGEEVATTVNWQTTPVGEVLEKLIESDYKKVDKYNASELQDLVDTTVKVEKIPPTIIDTEQIAKYVRDTGGKNPSSPLPLRPRVTITGRVLAPDGQTPCRKTPCLRSNVFINHPPFQQVTTDAEGRYKIPDVTPGVWKITSNGGGSITVQVKNDGTIIPAEPEIVNEFETPVQTGIVEGTYCNEEFRFSVSRPNANWSIREADPDNPDEASFLVILAKSFDPLVYAEVMITASKTTPGPMETVLCDYLLALYEAILKDMEAQLGLSMKVEKETAREIVIQDLPGIECIYRITAWEEITKSSAEGTLKFIFLQGEKNSYAFMFVGITEGTDIADIIADFDKILDSFRILKC